MSYLEIYNEEARDLLFGCGGGGGGNPPPIHIRDGGSEGVMVQGLSSRSVSSPEDVSDLMKSAADRRVVASTAMNAVSSRSHAICTLYVTVAPPEADGDDDDGENGSGDGGGDNGDDSGDREEIRAKLTLVDLAGSERIKKTGAEGARMKEGININKGLFVLGQVISALSELGQQKEQQQQQGGGSSSSSSGGGGSSNAHIPYRDSKLTRLLQDSLGGESFWILGGATGWIFEMRIPRVY